MLAPLPLSVVSFSSPTGMRLSLIYLEDTRANLIIKLLFPVDPVMAGGVKPRIESSCRAETLPSSAPVLMASGTVPCIQKVPRRAFILQLIPEPPSAPPKYRDTCEGLPLGGTWNTFPLRISANPPHLVRWGKHCHPHFTDEETNARSSPEPCPASHNQYVEALGLEPPPSDIEVLWGFPKQR